MFGRHVPESFQCRSWAESFEAAHISCNSSPDSLHSSQEGSFQKISQYTAYALCNVLYQLPSNCPQLLLLYQLAVTSASVQYPDFPSRATLSSL